LDLKRQYRYKQTIKKNPADRFHSKRPHTILCLPASKVESVDLKAITLWKADNSNRFNISLRKVY